jgi:hypothetical protein
MVLIVNVDVTNLYRRHASPPCFRVAQHTLYRIIQDLEVICLAKAEGSDVQWDFVNIGENTYLTVFQGNDSINRIVSHRACIRSASKMAGNFSYLTYCQRLHR